MKNMFCMIILFLAAGIFAGGAASDLQESRDDIPVAFSESSNLLLTTNHDYRGLYLINLRDNSVTAVSNGLNAGYHAGFSPDGKFICFKGFMEKDGARLQAAMLYSVPEKRLINLSSWQERTGTPAVSASGRIAFTVGHELLLLTPDYSLLQTFPLPGYVNLLDFSSDGGSIAYGDDRYAIHILETARGIDRIISDGTLSCWKPQFSPDGKSILTSTINGNAVLLDPFQKSGAPEAILLLPHRTDRRGSRFLEYLESPVWLDDGNVAAVRHSVDGKRNRTSELCILNRNTGEVRQTQLGSGSSPALIHGLELFHVEKDLLLRGAFRPELSEENGITWKEILYPDQYLRTLSSKADMVFLDIRVPGPLYKRSGVSQGVESVVIKNVPYLHQVYDTPDNFNGNWACNASSAVMALAYYTIIEKKPVTCSGPESHVSDYGFYVSEVYTFKSFTFNLGSLSPSDILEYGGYGYITRNNWVDTKGYMRDYIRLHGAESEVDWSPTLAKAKREIDNRNPFVLLNSLSTAGHYITCIGYFNGSREGTLIFNDPWGDKNDEVWKTFRSGIGAYYDLPGVNNGYANLNGAHCFIYCRSKPPVLTGNVKGHIFLAGNDMGDVEGNRINGAVITLSRDPDGAMDTVVTGSEGLEPGYFSLEGIEPGEYTISISASGYTTVEQQIEVSEDMDTWSSIGLYQANVDMENGFGNSSGTNSFIMRTAGRGHVDFTYSTPKGASVSVEIYSLEGKLITSLPGQDNGNVRWNLLESGIERGNGVFYLAALRINGMIKGSSVRKVLVSR